MAINIYSVRQDLESKGWLLRSPIYKNLQTSLDMTCPNGHEISDTYEHWRKYPICTNCLKMDATYICHNEVPEKSGTCRILALDAATITTGYAIYDDTRLVSYGSYTIHDSDITERINKMKLWIAKLHKNCSIDQVLIEHIQLQTYGMQSSTADGQVEVYRKLANLQGVLMDICFEIGAPVELIYSSVWRQWCDVRGKTRSEKKKQAQQKVIEWLGLVVSEDEADAICLGRYYTLRNTSSFK